MKKSLGVKPFVFPMPVLMIATYGENGKVNVMNMAWGGVCDDDKVLLNISAGHKTAANLKKRQAFTLSIADTANVAAADYVGMVSGNKVPDKFEKSGLHAVTSEHVDAPVIEEFPVTLECKVVEIREEVDVLHVVGKIVNVLASEKVLDAKGQVDPVKVDALVFDPFQHGYYAVGKKVGQAWQSGSPLDK